MTVFLYTVLMRCIWSERRGSASSRRLYFEMDGEVYVYLEEKELLRPTNTLYSLDFVEHLLEFSPLLEIYPGTQEDINRAIRSLL